MRHSLISRNLWHILLLTLLLYFLPAGAVASKCYSCMSRFYAQMWQYAQYSQIYMEPRAFTDDCPNPTRRGAEVSYNYCENGINCVSMVEELPIGNGARGYIRGCWDSIFRYGFNRTGLSASLRGESFCHTFNMSQLVNANVRFDSKMTVCSCSGHMCNGETMSASRLLPNPHTNYLLITLLLLLLRICRSNT